MYYGRAEKVLNSLIFVRFQVLTAASMSFTVSWDIASCSLVETDRRFSGACFPQHRCGEKYAGSKHIWNIAQLLPDYAA